MQFSPTSEEQVLLSEFSSHERFEYAIPRIFECEEVWGLGDDNGWLIRDVDDKEIISIWPYKSMAEAYTTGELKGNKPICVSLEYFLYRLLKQCEENDVFFEVNPAPHTQGYIVSAKDLFSTFEDMVESGSYFLEG